MIVQACINGARQPDYHPELPISIGDVVREAAACIKAGASELHVHVRDGSGRESLHPDSVAATMRALRQELPGTLIGISTGAWIEDDEPVRLSMIQNWADLPDHASVNLGENGAFDVMRALTAKGIAIEAGLGSVADAHKLLALDSSSYLLRVLVEVVDQEVERAIHESRRIIELLASSRSRKSVLMHGFDGTVWPLVNLAAERGYSTRVGFEDGSELPDGSVADSNSELVAAAVSIMRGEATSQWFD
jgi:uncharacterized protein (DUF849 family)